MQTPTLLVLAAALPAAVAAAEFRISGSGEDDDESDPGPSVRQVRFSMIVESNSPRVHPNTFEGAVKRLTIDGEPVPFGNRGNRPSQVSLTIDRAAESDFLQFSFPSSASVEIGEFILLAEYLDEHRWEEREWSLLEILQSGNLTSGFPDGAVFTFGGFSVLVDGFAEVGSALVTSLLVRMEHLIGDFLADKESAAPGEAVTLRWTVRQGATMTISGIGDVAAFANSSGNGSLTVVPPGETTYTMTATADGGETEQASVHISIRPPRLTGITAITPDSLQLTWTDSDGTNDIQASPDGVTWSTIATDVTSPATVAADFEAEKIRFFRIVEP